MHRLRVRLRLRLPDGRRRRRRRPPPPPLPKPPPLPRPRLRRPRPTSSETQKRSARRRWPLMGFAPVPSAFVPEPAVTAATVGGQVAGAARFSPLLTGAGRALSALSRAPCAGVLRAERPLRREREKERERECGREREGGREGEGERSNSSVAVQRG